VWGLGTDACVIVLPRGYRPYLPLSVCVLPRGHRPSLPLTSTDSARAGLNFTQPRIKPYLKPLGNLFKASLVSTANRTPASVSVLATCLTPLRESMSNPTAHGRGCDAQLHPGNHRLCGEPSCFPHPNGHRCDRSLWARCLAHTHGCHICIAFSLTHPHA